MGSSDSMPWLRLTCAPNQPLATREARATGRSFTASERRMLRIVWPVRTHLPLPKGLQIGGHCRSRLKGEVSAKFARKLFLGGQTLWQLNGLGLITPCIRGTTSLERVCVWASTPFRRPKLVQEGLVQDHGHTGTSTKRIRGGRCWVTGGQPTVTGFGMEPNSGGYMTVHLIEPHLPAF